MIVRRGLEIKYKNDAVVAVGNFDGVHLGHQYLFKKVFDLARAKDLKKVCITFEPHPKEYFFRCRTDGKATKRITVFKDKISFLKKLGFDLVWVIKFNKTTADLAPKDFIDKLINNLNLKYLLVGKDFKFGKDRLGDTNLLYQAAEQYSFKLITAEDFVINNQRVSSNLIRGLLDLVALADVKKYLSRYYGFSGKVVDGQKKGKQIGYPTANIHVKATQLLLAPGVYAVFIIYKNKKYKAMANWGIRPTLSQVPTRVLEAHLFDFAQDIYGQEVIVEFVEKVRDEKKFSSLEELKLQLADDARVIKKKLEIFENTD